MTDAALVIIGDSLLDRDITGTATRACPDAPSAPVVDVDSAITRPGGAALAALLSASDGIPTTLVTPLAEDAEGYELRRRLEQAGVRVLPLGHRGGTRVKTRLRVSQPSQMTIARMDTGGPGHPVGPVAPRLAQALEGAGGVLLSCYGGGISHQVDVRKVLTEWLRRQRPLVWDPHPNGAEPISGCTLLSPNLLEARARTGLDEDVGSELAKRLVREWDAAAVAVTAGAEGAYLAVRGGRSVHHVPCERAADGDTCGAGDRFAVSAAVALAQGHSPLQATKAAVSAASEFVTAGGAAALTDGSSAARRPIVVATGGCFDILHAGHVQLLEQARNLGDRLIVLVNSDASVRRLKGPSRPIHRLEDRVRMLRGLACVDSVAVFEEDDPRAALGRIRPHIWVKGGDYAAEHLPETDLLRSWGGRVITLPSLPGRSTTAALHALNGGSQ